MLLSFALKPFHHWHYTVSPISTADTLWTVGTPIVSIIAESGQARPVIVCWEGGRVWAPSAVQPPLLPQSQSKLTLQALCSFYACWPLTSHPASLHLSNSSLIVLASPMLTKTKGFWGQSSWLFGESNWWHMGLFSGSYGRYSDVLVIKSIRESIFLENIPILPWFFALTLFRLLTSDLRSIMTLFKVLILIISVVVSRGGVITILALIVLMLHREDFFKLILAVRDRDGP